ncbi:MAG TPA: hypothetical protein VK699_20910 [Terriglobales bacterium]|jgi:hypothetical protein|nr:hypothetical protein [Terriglobales bacterium]
MDTRQHSSSPLENPEVLHEEADINVRGIVGFGLGLALTIGLSALVLYAMFDYLRGNFTPKPVAPSPLIGVREPVEPNQAPELFPSPRLQTDYYGDLEIVRKQWEQQLETNGWVDKNAGIVHIKIEDAMKLTLQRGLPARPAAAQQPLQVRTAGAGKQDQGKLLASRSQ